MFQARQSLLSVLVIISILAWWAPLLWGHSRPLPRASGPTATAPHPVSGKAAPQLLSPPWRQVRDLEEAGESVKAIAFLLEFANLNPSHPDRAAALLKAAELARQDGQINKAVKVYTLITSLYPATQTSTQASLAALTLTLYRELAEENPMSAFRHFLERVAALTGPIPPEALAEPLEAGWIAVSRTLQGQAPIPPVLVEEVLLLWDLLPQGARPPVGALLVAGLLKEQGLHTEAAAILVRLWEHGPAAVQNQALFNLLDLAFGNEGLPGVLETLTHLPQKRPELAPALKIWFSRMLPNPPEGESSQEQAEKLGNEIIACVAQLPQKQGHRLLPAHLLEKLLRRPWPKPLKEKLLLDLANLHWSQGRHPQAVQFYQDLLDHHPSPEVAAFCQDRLALSRLKEGSLDSAQGLYQGLEKENDQFWQLLAHTRLMDLELARLKAEPNP